MITPIVSFLIPSRGRPGKLLGTLASIHRSAVSRDTYEILVRLDKDDLISLSCLEDFDATVFIGEKPSRGYIDINLLYGELEAQAKAPWIWVFNDDCWIRGKTWDTQLVSLPVSGLIVQPSNIQNNTSFYKGYEGSPFPIVPRDAWKPFSHVFPCPADTYYDQILREKAGWRTHFLDGVTIVHDRENHT